MNRRAWLILLLGGLLIFWLAACSSNEGTTPSSEEAATTSEAETTAPPAATDAGEPAAEPVEAPESVESVPVETTTRADTAAPEAAFADAATALEGLDSYRYQTLFTFAGEEDGEIEAGSIELIGVVAGPDEVHLTWHDLGEDEQFDVVRVGSRAWILEDEEWNEVPVMVADAMTDAVLIYAPSVAWGGIFGELEPTATYVGRETVNGVSAHRYSSTYEQWAGYWPGQLENAAADVWIAEAGYPVKYHFSATGVDEEGDRGTVTWQMDLTDVNADLSIEPPVASGEDNSR